MTRPWIMIERVLLALLMLAHGYLFFARMGVVSGWDAGPLLGHLGSISWTSFLPAIDSGFYSYHPPLAFLIFRTVQMTGVSDVVAVQIVSMSCSILAFLAIRRVLRLLELREEPVAIAFLYIAFSVPLILSLATTMNLDSFMLLLTCALLLLCVRAFVLPGQRTARARMLHALGIAAIIVAAMFIKFSGLLLTAIPVITALCGDRPRRHLPGAVAACVAALVFVFPFYYSHYYVVSGTFFPHNADLLEEFRSKSESVRALRDADRVGFFRTLITPAKGLEQPGERDYNAMRLSDTWRDFWASDTTVIPMTEATASVAAFYLKLMPALFAAGVLGIFLRMFSRDDARKRKSWRTLGLILLGVATVQIAAICHFVYNTPIADWRSGKAIYIASAALPLAFVLAHCLVPVERVLRKLRVGSGPVHLLLAALVAGFLLVNHLVPVY